MLAHNKTTLRNLQSVIGLLNFAGAVVVPGRAFLRRLIDLTIGISKPYHHIRLSQEVKKDLQVWYDFLETFNGKTLYLSEMFLSPDTKHLYTDAAKGLGFAAVLQSHWFYGTWQAWWSEQNITLLELVPIVLALETWGEQLRNSAVVLHTDNEALVWVINRQTSKEKLVMVMVRRMVRATLSYNITCHARHISGTCNQLADSLSRLHVARFRLLHPHADQQPSAYPSLPPALD